MQFAELPSQLVLGGAFDVHVSDVPGSEDEHQNLCVGLCLVRADGADFLQAGVLALDADDVVIEEGCAFFDGIRATLVPGAEVPPTVSIVCHLKTFDGDVRASVQSDPITISAGSDAVAGAAIEVADDADAPQLLAGAIAASDRMDVMRLRHCLQLLRSRLWASATNDVALAAAGAPTRVVLICTQIATAAAHGDVLSGAAVDAIVDGTAVILEMLGNLSGAVVMSCAGCRAVAGPSTSHMVRVGGDEGPVFHPGCVSCGGCKKELVTPDGAPVACVRNAQTMQPWHATCVSTGSPHAPVAVSAIPLHPGDAKPPGLVGELLLSADFADAVRSLVSAIDGTSALADNDFVKQRLRTLQQRAANVQALDLARALNKEDT